MTLDDLGTWRTAFGAYEVRTWPSWRRHITLSQMALARLAVVRAQTNDRPAASQGSPAPLRAGRAAAVPMMG